MITPAGVLLLPLLVVSIYRRTWAVVCLLVSVPFTALELVYVVSHAFTLPELALISLLFSHLLHVARTKELLVPTSYSVSFLLGFAVICLLSVVHLLIDPLDAMTHTYNTGSLDAFVLRPIGVSVTNVTQLVLRLFAVGAIIGLATVLTQYDIDRMLRLLIACSLLVGAFGLFYQFTQAIDATGIWTFANTLGLDIKQRSGGFFAVLPRMWTMVGEPGYTASYLLYVFSLATTLSVLPETRVLDRRYLRVAAIALFVLLVLSTSTTAYGGLLIFAAVLFVATLLTRSLPTRTVGAVYGTFVLGVVLLVGAVGVLTDLNVIALLEPQLAKLQFKAGSGTLRLRYISMSFDLFSQRPLFGVGVGSYYGASVLGTLLAETGILGFAAFVLAHLSAYWECLRANRTESADRRSISIALVVSSTVLLGTSLLAKSITTLMFPWFWLSLALPTALSLQSKARSVSLDEISRYYDSRPWLGRNRAD